MQGPNQPPQPSGLSLSLPPHEFVRRAKEMAMQHAIATIKGEASRLETGIQTAMRLFVIQMSQTPSDISEAGVRDIAQHCIREGIIFAEEATNRLGKELDAWTNKQKPSEKQET